MTHPSPDSPHLPVRRRHRQREGAVMLVALLIIMVGTAAAMLALNTANSEMQATGHERIALQTRNVADAAMVTTISWINLLGGTGQWLRTWDQWRAAGPPDMTNYPEPAIDPLNTSGFASRTTMGAERALNIVGANEVGIVCNPPAAGTGGTGGTGGSGGAGGSGGTTSSSDPCDSSFDTTNQSGSFGPTQAYGLPANLGYVVDITDCLRAPAALAPGSPLGGSSSYDVIAFNCTVTARGRLEIGGTSRTWSYGSTPSFTQRVFASAHDARAMIVTPEMVIAK